MAQTRLRIVSRKSPLALWQAQYVQDQLQNGMPGLQVEIIGIKTRADMFLDKSLSVLGGKGAFVKELEQALLSGAADIAVHSMKDVTVDLPEGLSLPVIMQREDPRDAFVSNGFHDLGELPVNAVVGTSSLRRRCQLKAWRSDLRVEDIRGNVDTRLKKLDDGRFDAIILAAAGLMRLGLQDRITGIIPTEQMLPAIGQGAMGIEARAGDEEVLALIAALNDGRTHTCVTAERAFNKRLNGGCHAPVAAHARIENGRIHIEAVVGSLDGSELLQSSLSGNIEEAGALGERLGNEMLEKGAGRILAGLSPGPS